MTEKHSYEELEEKVASLTSENYILSMMMKAVETIPLSLDFEESARRIYDICKAIIGATCGYVALLTEDGHQNEVLFLDDGGLFCDVDPLKTPYPWWPDEAMHKTQADFEKAMVHGAEKLEERFKKKTGEAFSVEITSKPVRKGKKLAYYLANWVDISERKRAETTLRKSESKYRTMMEAIQDPVYICSENYRVQYMNQAMIKRIGRDGTGEPCYTALHDFDEICPWCKKEEIHGEAHGTKNIVSPKDNRSFSISSTILSNEDGSTSKISVFRDTTDFEELHDRLQQAQKMETMGNIAGGIAHDFNNILFPIVGISELLLEDLPSDSLEYQNVQQILKAGERGADLVSQILAFSRQSDHKMMPVRAQQIVKEVLKLTRSTIPSNIEISEFIQSDCGFVMANATQLHQVAMNLITNAYHAVEQKGGKISVNLNEIAFAHDHPSDFSLKSGRYVMLSVSDTGHGIDPAVMDKIFDPYFTTKEKGKGTGLGLSVVHGIIQSHGGDIRVKSDIGLGTTFSLLLPCLTEETKDPSPRKSGPIVGGTEHILLVDDDLQILEMEKELLERLGYRVTTRNAGTEALKAFKAHPDQYDLVITDMTMPRMTGATLAGELMKIRPGIPIMIATGFSEQMDEARAGELGIRAYLIKPMTMTKLSGTIRRVLNDDLRRV